MRRQMHEIEKLRAPLPAPRRSGRGEGQRAAEDVAPRVARGLSAVSAIWKTIWMRRSCPATLRDVDGRQRFAVEPHAPRASGISPAMTRASVIFRSPIRR